MENIKFYNEGGFPALKMWSPESFITKENDEGFLAVIVRAPISGELNNFIYNISYLNKNFKYNLIRNKGIDLYIFDGETTLLIADIPLQYEKKIEENLFGVVIEDIQGEPRIYFELI